MDQVAGIKATEYGVYLTFTDGTAVIYRLLDVDSLQAYISGFLANICVNIVSVLLVFVVVWLAVKFVLQALHIISKLPGYPFGLC